MLDPGFFDWIKITQSERAEAAAYQLKSLEDYMTSKGVYVHVIKVPGNASFWKQYPERRIYLHPMCFCTMVTRKDPFVLEDRLRNCTFNLSQV